ncbi:hypothetical protein [Streptomyces sp. NPDC090445]|uniref:hypothetical protein n=1 Tax=Streptomyces sp. NPDC090445 TaxID=3365963 RepID=UPI00382D06A8
MSLHEVDLAEISEETARVARALFPKVCLAMRVRDVVSLARLALASVFQFAEGLTDRQALCGALMTGLEVRPFHWS